MHGRRLKSLRLRPLSNVVGKIRFIGRIWKMLGFQAQPSSCCLWPFPAGAASGPGNYRSIVGDARFGGGNFHHSATDGIFHLGEQGQACRLGRPAAHSSGRSSLVVCGSFFQFVNPFANLVDGDGEVHHRPFDIHQFARRNGIGVRGNRTVCRRRVAIHD